MVTVQEETMDEELEDPRLEHELSCPSCGATAKVRHLNFRRKPLYREGCHPTVFVCRACREIFCHPGY